MIFLTQRNWSAYLAGKAIALSVVAIGAAVVLTRMALPRLIESLNGAGREVSPLIALGLEHRSLLPFLPIPGLLLGVAAFILRPLRSPLAILAMIVAVVSTAAIIGLLLGSMAPLYQVPRGF